MNSDRPFQIKLPVFARPEVSFLNFYCGGMTSEAYSDPYQTFTMKRFAKIVDSFQLLHVFTKSVIFDVWQSSKYASGPIYVHSYYVLQVGIKATCHICKVFVTTVWL